MPLICLICGLEPEQNFGYPAYPDPLTRHLLVKHFTKDYARVYCWCGRYCIDAGAAKSHLFAFEGDESYYTHWLEFALGAEKEHWISEEDAKIILQAADTWAHSKLNGWPKDDIEWKL